MLKKLSCFLLLLGLTMAAYSKADCPDIIGVKPSDTTTSFEINPSISVLDDAGGVSVTQLTAKYYYSFAKHYSIGVELPIARYESPSLSKNGLGDILLSTSYKGGEGLFTYGFVLEATLPSASEDILGINKLQVAPSAFGVLSFSNNVFVAFGYKQFATVMGPSDKPDVNMGRVRAVVAYLDNNDWWVLLDPQYYINYNKAHEMEFYTELELGTMIKNNMAMYIKAGRHIAGNMRGKDWSLSFGVKLLSI